MPDAITPVIKNPIKVHPIVSRMSIKINFTIPLRPVPAADPIESSMSDVFSVLFVFSTGSEGIKNIRKIYISIPAQPVNVNMINKIRIHNGSTAKCLAIPAQTPNSIALEVSLLSHFCHT